MDSILKKIGEETTEQVLAAKGGDAKQIVHETAERPGDAVQELGRRLGVSGLDEKAQRQRGQECDD